MIKVILLGSILFIAIATEAQQSVGIGTTTPNSSAALDINSTTKGVLFPRMTTSQRFGITTPPNGLIVYDTDKNELYHYNGSGWSSILNGEFWIRPITARNRISNANDSVGIGTNSPGEWLDVNGNIRSRNNLLVGGVLQIDDQTIGKFSSISLEFSSNIVPVIDDSRSLGLNIRRFTAVWATDGTINTSDARDKTKIEDINYGLSEIMRLRPVSFQWKNKPRSGTKLGLIAQEVETVLPEVVANPKRNPALLTENGDSAAVRLGMYYSDLVPVLIKAVQELSKQNDDLKKQIDELKTQVTELQKKLMKDNY